MVFKLLCFLNKLSLSFPLSSMYFKSEVNWFQGFPFVDLNVRTIDGRLPEEMTSRRSIQRLVMEARQAQPQSTRFVDFCKVSFFRRANAPEIVWCPAPEKAFICKGANSAQMGSSFHVH